MKVIQSWRLGAGGRAVPAHTVVSAVSTMVDRIPSSMVYQSFSSQKTMLHIHLNAERRPSGYDTCLDVS